MTGWRAIGLVSLAAAALAGCDDAKKLPIGASCQASGECDSGLCYAAQCVDPSADTDHDEVPDSVEAALGSNPNAVDSDGDGVDDADELHGGYGARDSDGDGTPDILESAVADADEDCTPDQDDAHDDAPDPPPAGVALAELCRLEGLCAPAQAKLRARCVGGGEPVCDYRAVAGFSDPESACDGADENCDGRVDEGFDANADGVADCAEAPRVVPWLGPGGVGTEVRSANYRARLLVGPTAAGNVASPRFRAALGVGALPQMAPVAAPSIPEVP